MIYMNLILTFGLGMLLAAMVARLSQARRAFETAASGIPTETTVSRYIEGIVERDLPTALHNVFEERQARLAELRDEVRRNVRRETRDAIENADFHRKIDKVIEDKLERGAFATHVKQSLDEHYKALAHYIESEIVPRAVQKTLAGVDAAVLSDR